MKKKLVIGYIIAQVTFIGYTAMTGEIPGLRPLAQWETAQLQSAGYPVPVEISRLAGVR